MPPTFESALSSHDTDSVAIRDRTVATEVMDELSFPAAMYYLWTGTCPSAGEERLLDAMLTSMLSYGKTGSAIACRMVAATEPTAIQAAIASSVLCVGSRFGGTMQNCAEDLTRLAGAPDSDQAVRAFVAEHLANGDPINGLGHPYLHPVDPRAQRLFAIAESEAISGEHVEIVHELRDEVQSEIDRDIPINLSGAMAAVATDMGLSPPEARAIAAVSKAAGGAGEALEEQERPMALDIIEYVDGHTATPDGDGP